MLHVIWTTCTPGKHICHQIDRACRHIADTLCAYPAALSPSLVPPQEGAISAKELSLLLGVLHLKPQSRRFLNNAAQVLISAVPQHLLTFTPCHLVA